MTQVEEYQKGTDYAYVLKKAFSLKQVKHFTITKKGKSYKAVCFPDHEVYTVELPKTFLRASRYWLLNNGYNL